MLLLGTVTVGIAYSHSLGLSGAVREGSRFAAISPYPPTTGNWGDDVIARTRTAQADDTDGTTRLCVDLYKQGTGSLISQCSGPAALGNPAPFLAPATTPTGKCAIRVWAARRYDVNAVLVQLTNRVMQSQSIAIFERSPCGS